MNQIYDFHELDKLKANQRRLVFRYVICAALFLLCVIAACHIIVNNVLLTAVFAVLLTVFALYSVVFWKIKYGLLKQRRAFLDDMESGRCEDFVGVFTERVASSEDGEGFDVLCFIASNKKKELLIHRQNDVPFEKGKKYHLELVGAYVYGWESID